MYEAEAAGCATWFVVSGLGGVVVVAAARALADRLSHGAGADGCLLLVGHEPDLSGVAGELTGARLDLKKGGVAALRLDGPGGELVVLTRPRELVLIADVH